MLGVAAVFAQLTREMISENTKDGLLRRAGSGKFNGNLTQLYRYTYDSVEGKLVINEEEAQVVRQIFDWYTEHKWGTQKIASVLNLQRISTKTGKQWDQSSVQRKLSNALYNGDVRVNEAWINGQHAALVSAEQYEVAQQILEGRRQYPNRSQQSQHLLSGLACCGDCGTWPRAHYTYNRRKNGPSKSYIFYYHSLQEKAGRRCSQEILKECAQS